MVRDIYKGRIVNLRIERVTLPNGTVVDLELVRLCAENASEERRQRILKLAVDGRAFHHDPVAFRLLDIEFHQAINDGAGNRLLSALAQGLYDAGHLARQTANLQPDVVEALRQHCEVADAMIARDADAAVAAYRRHLEHVRDTTIDSMHAARP